MVKIPAIIVLFFLLFFSSANAQATSSSPSAATLEDKVNNRIDARKKLIEEKKEARINKIEEKAQARKEFLETRRENFLEKIQSRREQASAAAKLRRETFKKKVEALKDERKKLAVERIDERLETVNENRTNRFTQVIDKLQDILDRVSKKAEGLKTAGKDTTVLDKAIQDAQKAIDLAKASVTTQAGKTYILEVPNETVLKVSVGATVSKFRKDLAITHKTVVNARQAVHQAVRELARLSNARGIFNENSNEATDEGEIGEL